MASGSAQGVGSGFSRPHSFPGECLGEADRVAVGMTTWAWWRSRSTVALAMVLGISSSNPAGCRFDDRAMERFS